MAATSYTRSLGVPCSRYIDDRHLGQLRPRSKFPVNVSDFQLAEMGTFNAFTVLLELGYFLIIVRSVFIPRIKVKFLLFPNRVIVLVSFLSFSSGSYLSAARLVPYCPMPRMPLP